MSKKKPVIAIIYDFDKTLSTKSMQEYSFIPELGLSAAEFWREADALKNEGMDPILAYMYLMITKSRAANKPIQRKNFVSLGKNIEYYPGLEDWFERMRKYGDTQNVSVEHYIISSGLKEVIEGSKIYKHFKAVFACEFHYDVNGVVDWPLVAVNYTTKTQFLFRINKDVLSMAEHDALNKYTPEDERPVPFRNMIYIGDGMTDVPSMKLVKVNGGQSVAVYAGNQKAEAEMLLNDGRVNFAVKADYSEGKTLDKTVKLIIDKMAAESHLIAAERRGSK